MIDPAEKLEEHLAPQGRRKADKHGAFRNVAILTLLFMASLWGFFIYWAVTARQEAISVAETGLSQMTHAVEQYSMNLFKMAEIFQAVTERWLEENAARDPRTDPGFIALIEDFRKRTDNLIDIRMASATGDLYYFPNDLSTPLDNVSDREYFKAVIRATPGKRHIGIPVISRVSNQWRLPNTVRMKQAHHGLEVINASINLSALIKAFESERPRPRGTIALWHTNGTLLARAPQIEGRFGKTSPQSSMSLERVLTEPSGLHLTESGVFDGTTRLVSHVRLNDFPLVVVVTASLSDTLEPWHRQVRWVFIALVLVTLGGAMFAYRLVRALHAQNHYAIELERLATTDSLTGVVNRRQLLVTGIHEHARARRYNQPMSLLMLDIDHFKTVNDTWGHPTGDRVLQALAQVMNSIVRSEDTIGRLGGEEFALILPETDASGASVMADRILAAVRQSETLSTEHGCAVGITVSIGVATSSPTDVSFDAVLSRADKRLYEAKKSGRNCVVAD